MIRVSLLAAILVHCLGASVRSADKDCPHCPEMVPIPSAAFVVGDSPQEEEREMVPPDVRGRAAPSRPVTSMRASSLGHTEVARGQYKAFALATGRPPGTGCWTAASNGDWAYQQGLNWRFPGFTQADDESVVCVSCSAYRLKSPAAGRATDSGFRVARTDTPTVAQR